MKGNRQAEIIACFFMENGKSAIRSLLKYSVTYGQAKIVDTISDFIYEIGIYDQIFWQFFY